MSHKRFFLTNGFKYLIIDDYLYPTYSQTFYKSHLCAVWWMSFNIYRTTKIFDETSLVPDQKPTVWGEL
ncbi:hypothetical protein HanRHA438_Chr05g0216681 [Helianthus annuus]|nr:hypothetical protein HanRHA438_Chr05g0216681 [Helianthus annuus]